MLTKYGTFEIWENTETKKIKNIPLADTAGIEKKAATSKWKRRIDLEEAEGQAPSSK